MTIKFLNFKIEPDVFNFLQQNFKTLLEKQNFDLKSLKDILLNLEKNKFLVMRNNNLF